MTIQGIDRVARRSLLLHRLATLEQPGWVPRFSKAHHISPNLNKSDQISPNLTKDDQIWPRCSGSPRRAGGWTSWSQGWSGCSTLPGSRFASASSNPILFFCFPIQFGLVKPAPVQFSWVQVLKQRGEEEETCTAEVAPFNFFIILIHYHFLNLYCSHYYYHHYDQVAPFNCQQLVQDRFKLIHIVHKGTTRWFHAGSTDCLFEEWLFVSGENVGWRMQVVPSFCHLARWDRARLAKRRKRGNIPLIAI